MRAFWTLAAAAAAALLATSACSNGDDKAAFAAAKTAVAAKLPGGADADFGAMTMHHLTGLKGSKADVVCGGSQPKGAANSSDPSPFIYFAKLQPAAPNPGYAQGDVILLSPKLDRQAASQLTNFCEQKLSTALPNPFTYFN